MSSSPTLLDDVRKVMRLKHYSLHTERTYCDWIKQFVKFHRLTERRSLFENSEAKIEAFLTHLATHRHVAASTQNQAMNALVFLYKQVLDRPLEKRIDAVRSGKKRHIPVVLSTDEVKQILARLEGVPQLVVKILYGSGLRITEAVRLRVQELDFEYKQIMVRSGKGDKDRVTTFSAALMPLLRNHLDKVKRFMKRICPMVSVRSICRMRWRKNTLTPRGNGAGTMCFRPGRCRSTRYPA